MRILLAGATGNTGQNVAAALRGRGVDFGCLVRSEKNAAKVRALGYEPVLGDMDRPDTLRRAFEQGRYDRGYVVCTPDEHMVARECAFIDAAKAAGATRVVKLGAFWTGHDAISKNLRDHARIEDHLRDSGLEWTALRPHGFMQTFVLFSMDMIQGAGLYLHNGGDGAMALVDVRDVGLAGAKVLVEDGYTGQVFNLTGPEGLTYREQAAQLSRAFGRPVTAMEGNERDFVRVMHMLGVAEQSIEHASKIMEACRAKKLGEPQDGLARLGIPARSFATFTEDLAAGRTGGGNSFEPPDSVAFKVMSRAMIWGWRARFALFGRPA